MLGTLYLKGSFMPAEKNRLGVCIKSQRVFLILRLKKLEDVEVCFIDERTKQAHKDFQQLCSTMTPVLVYDSTEYQEADEIASTLESLGSTVSLTSANLEANALASKATPMSSLAGWIKNTDSSKEEDLYRKLYKTLDEINQVLGSTEGDFLDGDELKLPDCILLPKLYHASVAAKYARNYDLFKEFANIDKYLDKAKKNTVFQETCPLEVEIQQKWDAYKKKDMSKDTRNSKFFGDK